MGQTPPKYFLPSAPYGSSPASNTLNPTQQAAQNPQTPLLPPNFTDPGTMTQSATNASSPLSAAPAQSQIDPRIYLPKQFGGFA